MCRLFGLHTGEARTRAAFWLVDASDSLMRQSDRNPDGFGIGTFDAVGSAVVDKEPLPAWSSGEFTAAAHTGCVARRS